MLLLCFRKLWGNLVGCLMVFENIKVVRIAADFANNIAPFRFKLSRHFQSASCKSLPDALAECVKCCTRLRVPLETDLQTNATPIEFPLCAPNEYPPIPLLSLQKLLTILMSDPTSQHSAQSHHLRRAELFFVLFFAPVLVFFFVATLRLPDFFAPEAVFFVAEDLRPVDVRVDDFLEAAVDFLEEAVVRAVDFLAVLPLFFGADFAVVDLRPDAAFLAEADFLAFVLLCAAVFAVSLFLADALRFFPAFFVLLLAVGFAAVVFLVVFFGAAAFLPDVFVFLPAVFRDVNFFALVPLFVPEVARLVAVLVAVVLAAADFFLVAARFRAAVFFLPLSSPFIIL